MHNHKDDNGNGNSWMMWLMMACCILPVLFVGLAGRGAGLPSWIVLGLMAVFAAVHFWGMRKSRGGPTTQPDAETKPGESSSKSGSEPGCH